jgi:hypothetical protein
MYGTDQSFHWIHLHMELVPTAHKPRTLWPLILITKSTFRAYMLMYITVLCWRHAANKQTYHSRLPTLTECVTCLALADRGNEINLIYYHISDNLYICIVVIIFLASCWHRTEGQAGKKGSITHAQINDFLPIWKSSTMAEAMGVLPRQ